MLIFLSFLFQSASIPLRAVDYFRIAQPWKTEHIEYICSAFSCRALSESKPKAQLEVSANGTWTLNELYNLERKRDRAWEQTTIIP